MRSRRFLIGLFAVVALALTACGGGSLNLGDLGKITAKPCALPTALPVTTKVTIDCTATIKPPKTTTTTATTTTGPTTTTTTMVATSTTTTTTPPAGETWPTQATTGYPGGTVFTDQPDGTKVTTPNQVINGWHVHGGLEIDVPGVQITNSWIEGQILNENEPLTMPDGSVPARLVIIDTTVGATGHCDELPGIGEHDYTATRVKILDHGDGFRGSGNNVTVKDSFVQTCEFPQAHADDLQIYCPAEFLQQPCQNYDVEHNTFSEEGISDFTAPLFGGSDPNGNTGNGFIANSTFSDNLLWGGVFEIFLYGDGLKIDHNRLMINEWQNPNPDPGDSGDYHGSAYAKLPDGAPADGSVLYRPIVDSIGCGSPNSSWTDNREVFGDITTGKVTGSFGTDEVPCG
jgi:hypothetical protein